MSERNGWQTTLADGTGVILRRISPEDREALAEAYRRLSPEARYYRFWSRVRELNGRLLDQLAAPPSEGHVAWAAFPKQPSDEPGLGAGSFWRLGDDPDLAEMSFTVADEWRHRGLGSLLLAALWHDATARGVRAFVGHALADNFAATDWFSALGAVGSVTAGQIRWVLPLDEALLPGTSAARRLRQALVDARTAGVDGACS